MKPSRPCEAVNYLVLFIVVIRSDTIADTCYGNLRFRVSAYGLVSGRKRITGPGYDAARGAIERACRVITYVNGRCRRR